MIAVKKATGECSVVATFATLISVLGSTIIYYELQTFCSQEKLI
jgi:hypothetical protein